MQNHERFEISNKDRREELIRALETGEKFIAQKPTGKDVERFDERLGFYLLKKEVPINLAERRIQRAGAIAKLSLKFPKLGLREFYYTLRQHPEYTKAFEGVKPEALYKEIIDRINTLEIVADVDRIEFTISTSSKGYIYYPHSYHFGDPKRRVAFTEELAVNTLSEYDLPDCQNVVVIEKEAGANRLIEMGFPEICNSAVVTVGGMFNRAVFRFTQRFDEKFPLIFFCDGDVYGSKILSTVVVGSDRSRHLNLRSQNVYIAGLFPSVGEKIDLPNDVEQKRPLQNKEAQKMLEHIKKFGLVDDQDVKTWERNNTYELEALSTSFTNEKGEPIGLGIYLIEFMRLKNIPIKPMPDENSFTDFCKAVRSKIERRMRPKVDKSFLDEAIERIENELTSIIDNYEEEVHEEVLEEHEDEINEFLEEEDPELVKKHLIAQYCRNIRKRRYEIGKVADKCIKEASVEVEFDEELLEEIKKDIEEAIEEMIAKVKPKIEELLESARVYSTLELEHLKGTKVCDLYDKALEELGAKKEDVELIREALKQRLLS